MNHSFRWTFLYLFHSINPHVTISHKIICVSLSLYGFLISIQISGFISHHFYYEFIMRMNKCGSWSAGFRRSQLIGKNTVFTRGCRILKKLCAQGTQVAYGSFLISQAAEVPLDITKYSCNEHPITTVHC